jgi:putative oxidoreductase
MESGIYRQYRRADERKIKMDSVCPANFPRPVQVNLALLILRIASAMAFLYHGSAILFGAFGGPGPEKFAAGHHWPAVLAYLVGLAQVAGGLAFLTGILFRVGGACIVAVMLGAIFLVHLQRGFDIANGGAEYALTQLLLAIAFLLTGPGQYSLTSLLPRRLQKF